VAVEASPASHAAAEEAAILAFDLEAPLVFIYARRGPPGFLGTPFYQRRLTRDLERARRVLDQALRVAQLAGSRPRPRSSRAPRGAGSSTSPAPAARSWSSSVLADAGSAAASAARSRVVLIAQSSSRHRARRAS
jgi:nucleotide-binding universal stress UspA family protein